jgi:hypothetical protein
MRSGCRHCAYLELQLSKMVLLLLEHASAVTAVCESLRLCEDSNALVWAFIMRFVKQALCMLLAAELMTSGIIHGVHVVHCCSIKL